MTKIKICGLSREVDIEMINRIQPDYCGFILNFPKSKRNINIETLKKLTKNLSKSICSVAVFVNQDIEVIKECAKYVDCVQLHGNEDNAYISTLRKEIKNPILKAFIVASKEDVEIANQSIADYILLDGGKGNGKEFDWNLLQYVNREYFLAGGVGLDNMDIALQYKPYALDISSKVEKNGYKDEDLVLQVVDQIRKEV